MGDHHSVRDIFLLLTTRNDFQDLQIKVVAWRFLHTLADSSLAKESRVAQLLGYKGLIGKIVSKIR